MTDKTDFIDSMVNVFEQYGDEYTIEQAMEHVADYCQKNFAEQTENAADKCNFNSSKHRMPDPKAAYYVGIDDLMQAIKDKFK